MDQLAVALGRRNHVMLLDPVGSRSSSCRWRSKPKASHSPSSTPGP